MLAGKRTLHLGIKFPVGQNGGCQIGERVPGRESSVGKGTESKELLSVMKNIKQFNSPET